jgi:hypothetical protein
MRYIRTKDHVRRRLTLHHAETMRKARDDAAATLIVATPHNARCGGLFERRSR